MFTTHIFMCLIIHIKPMLSIGFFMNYFTQPQLFISAKAKKLGLQLIQELYIQRSARLAFYLDVNPCFDGHEAVLFWTEHYLAEYPDANFSDIQQQFIRSVPQS